MDGHRPALYEINRNLRTSKIHKQAPRIIERHHRAASERILFLIRSLDVSRRVNGFVHASTSIEQRDIKSCIDFGIYSLSYFCVYDTIYTYMGIVSPCGQEAHPQALLRHLFFLAKIAPPCHASPRAAPCHPYPTPVFAPRPRSVLTFPSCPARPARGAPRRPSPKEHGPYLAAAAHAHGASTSVSDSREHAPLAGWLQLMKSLIVTTPRDMFVPTTDFRTLKEF
jgi:hypothetical protein